ncbi:PrgI family protein [Gulosibacter sp. GYB002]|uniref:PrgI family protein n=1 Tax=Gulosibacter sp. GYB002 TaxID=2994391 RepID=UPI002F96D16B
MALEVKVYKEITDYQAKVMMGMSWRQLACAICALVLGGGVFAIFYVLNMKDLGQWLAALIAVPFGAFGWVRPRGLPFEKYAGYVLAHQWNSKRRIYAQEPIWQVDEQRKDYGVPVQSTRRNRNEVVECGR